MIVRASVQGVVVEDPRNLTALSLTLDGEGAETTAARIGEWADPDHLVVPARTLVELAGPVAADPEWRAGFDAMIAYATSRGWVDADGGVRIHVERG